MKYFLILLLNHFLLFSVFSQDWLKVNEYIEERFDIDSSPSKKLRELRSNYKSDIIANFNKNFVTIYKIDNNEFQKLGNQINLNLQFENINDISLNGIGDEIIISSTYSLDNNNLNQNNASRIITYKYDTLIDDWTQVLNVLEFPKSKLPSFVKTNYLGNILVVSNTVELPDNESIIIYIKENDKWKFHQEIFESNHYDITDIDYWEISVDSIGDRISVLDLGRTASPNWGNIFIYKYDTISNFWIKEYRIEAPIGLGFRLNQKLSNDGSMLVVTSYDCGPDLPENGDCSAIIIYKRNQLNQWNQSNSLLNYNPGISYGKHEYADFGTEIYISRDNSTVSFNNSSYPDDTHYGRILVYNIEDDTIKKFNNGIIGEYEDEFSGHSFIMNQEGNKFLICSPFFYGELSWMNEYGNGRISIFDYSSDIDNDSINENLDNCPLIFNPDQLDTDNDGIGDACDTDDDDDGILDTEDNCPLTANTDQLDTDSDGIGDVCDNDDDGDGVEDSLDNCPLVANPDQADWNNNGVGDICGDPRPLFIEKVTFVENIYPNPTDDKLKVSIRRGINIKDIYFVDLSGKLLKPKSISRNKSNLEINVSNLEEGIYILEILSGREADKVKVVIER